MVIDTVETRYSNHSITKILILFFLGGLVKHSQKKRKKKEKEIFFTKPIRHTDIICYELQFTSTLNRVIIAEGIAGEIRKPSIRNPGAKP